MRGFLCDPVLGVSAVRAVEKLFTAEAQRTPRLRREKHRHRLVENMSTTANVERKIRRVEGFDVRILHLRGADVRGDRAGMPQYPFRHAAADDITVEHWKETRFRPTFAGFEVDVLDGRANSVQGNTKLSTVRASY
jgi:hypothetical protein